MGKDTSGKKKARTALNGLYVHRSLPISREFRVSDNGRRFSSSQAHVRHIVEPPTTESEPYPSPMDLELRDDGFGSESHTGSAVDEPVDGLEDIRVVALTKCKRYANSVRLSGRVTLLARNIF